MLSDDAIRLGWPAGCQEHEDRGECEGKQILVRPPQARAAGLVSEPLPEAIAREALEVAK